MVAPSQAASTEGNANSIFPFSTTSFGLTSMRYQQVYSASEFSSMVGPHQITEIAFRPDAALGLAFFSNITSVQFNLSTTSIQPDNLSATFANNVGLDDTVVRSGSIIFDSAFTGPVNGPKDFDIIVPFTTPFVYDPALGNLLLDIRIFDGGVVRSMDAVFSSTDGGSRALTFIGETVNTPTASIVDSLALVTRFTTSPIPEPTSASLLILGLTLAFRRAPKQGRGL